MPLLNRTQRALPERTPAGVGWWSALLAAALLGLWSVSPSTAPFTGGTAVTLTGTGFVVGAGVTFNGAATTNVIVPARRRSRPTRRSASRARRSSSSRTPTRRAGR